MEKTVTSTAPDSRSARAVLRTQRIELPSWAFGNSGTRFKVFAQKGVPRTAYEKIDDAAQVNRYTGVAPTVALHIPWDKVDDYADLARHAAEEGAQRGVRPRAHHDVVHAVRAHVLEERRGRVGTEARAQTPPETPSEAAPRRDRRAQGDRPPVGERPHLPD